VFNPRTGKCGARRGGRRQAATGAYLPEGRGQGGGGGRERYDDARPHERDMRCRRISYPRVGIRQESLRGNARWQACARSVGRRRSRANVPVSPANQTVEGAQACARQAEYTHPRTGSVALGEPGKKARKCS